MKPSPHAARVRRRSSTAPAEILESTQALLLEQGVDGLSIRRVSERCGYSAPTIYHHFGDKQGLIVALLEQHFRTVLDLMRAIPRSGDTKTDLQRMARAFMHFALENPDHYRLLVTPGLSGRERVSSAEAARELVKQSLRELASQGELLTADVDAAFQTMWAVLHGVISLHLMGHDDVDGQVADLVFEMVERGLLRPPFAVGAEA